MSTLAVIDETHDPDRRSWVLSANEPEVDFPIQNLPFGVFRRLGSDEVFRCGVAIGDQIVDVSGLQHLFRHEAKAAAQACAAKSLNGLMALGRGASTALRRELSALLDAANGPENRAQVEKALCPIADMEMGMPFKVSGFTDFFASVHHATNAGSLFRPNAPLLPNYKYVPIGYNGRANSVRLSGPVRRPHGQIKLEGLDEPLFAATRRLDYEVELGICIGEASQSGSPIQVKDGWDHVFGVCLLNDWSARDIQTWEYQPLGPFLAKSFATSISPWVVTSDALAPFRTFAYRRPLADPSPLPHLLDEGDQAGGGVSVRIKAWLSTEAMRAHGMPAQQLSCSDSSTLYWTISQMIAHHTSNGSSLDAGDLLGTGTISGASTDTLGSLLEITRGGSKPFVLPSGESRGFLEDGDEVVLRGKCEKNGYVSIGFGECRGWIMSAG